ncbi:PTPA-CTERM sorting domain-containing protein [Leptolyngbya sp. 7M]|uniref:PTPA-CTERM sorting domain-containing protein n=1 Tax=Leptolyngbya sp. 7M TaxID=2812896 RepID=UPI001B8ABEC5|nr:PTPA-CTERM sorting domain-containing protein [Leptolyngbya sp. 7M]QYO63326.1 PTPA-CTERM sorting domain-containing protein [Leptolyngbya sp. 7M]
MDIDLFSDPSLIPGAVSSGLFLSNGNITPIPTPALLPGLIGMGLAALRKKNQEERVEQEA